MPLKSNPSQSLDESFCLPSLRAPPKEIDLERCDIVCEKVDMQVWVMSREPQMEKRFKRTKSFSTYKCKTTRAKRRKQITKFFFIYS